VLTDFTRFPDLVQLYKGKHLHRKALELLARYPLVFPGLKVAQPTRVHRVTVVRGAGWGRDRQRETSCTGHGKPSSTCGSYGQSTCRSSSNSPNGFFRRTLAKASRYSPPPPRIATLVSA
jgi:hypothetical protein